MTRRAPALLILLLVLTACKPLTPAEERSVQRWLLCEECTEGELDSVLALGSRGERALETALNGPPQDRLDNIRLQAEAMYALIPSRPAPSQQKYVDHFLGNYKATYVGRAADALGRINTPTAHAALVTALRHDTLYREDVRRLLGASAGAVALVVAGDSQHAPVDSFVRVNPVIEVRDTVARQPLSGMRVVFRVDSGAGRVGDSLTHTNAGGQATVRWRLGPTDSVNVLAVVAAGRTLRLRALGYPNGLQEARGGAWTRTAPEGDWQMPGRDYSLQRFSPLKQITTANVANLKAAWSFSLGTLRGQEGNPLVVGNVMYVNTSFPNIVYALDLSKPGAPMIWKYVPNQSPDAIPIACCDLVNRGTAYHPSGKIFINALQGELIALDAKTGKELWKAKHPDHSDAGPEAIGYKQGATITVAPIVIKDIVITGISGGEFGVRGRVSAFDVNTGQHKWTMYSTGPDKEVGIEGDANANYASHKGKDLGVSTWQGDEWKRGGGTTWGWYSYDPELDLFIYSVGNPGTWNPDQRPGDNKWSMTIFARKPDTGKVVWAYQMTPHDEWDYDGVNENVLFESGGKKLLAHFDRNGIGYTLDRTNGKVIVANAYGPINWAKSKGTGTPVEGVVATGVPVKDPKYGTTSKHNTEGICPAAIGFKDQQPSAYSPITGLFYVPTNHICMDYEGVEVKYSAGQPYVGAIVRMFPGPGGNRGRFIAWDPMTGTVKWEVKENLAAYGGAMTTAGGLVFYGTMEGWLKALDQKTGKELWKFKTPSGIIGSPMTYLGPDKKQYIAVYSGIGGWAGIGVAAGIGAEDPTAGLGALGAFGDAGNFTNQGGVMTVFGL